MPTMSHGYLLTAGTGDSATKGEDRGDEDEDEDEVEDEDEDEVEDEDEDSEAVARVRG